MSGYEISLSGLRAQSRKVETLARNIANTNNNAPEGNFIPIDTVTISRENGGVATADIQSPGMSLENQLIGLSSAKNSFEANAKVIKAQDEMDRALLDILT